MLELLKKLYPLRLAPNSPDTDRFADIIREELDFSIKEYHGGYEHNGWKVPYSWYVTEATIKKENQLIYDGMVSPLGVIGYSQPFQGVVDLEELKKHLFYKLTYPEAIVYHCDLYYKVNQSYWGFCMPLNQINKLEEGMYEVSMKTHFDPGTLKVLYYHLQGRSNETIIINAHNCHAGQANDDIAGVVVGVELIKRLSRLNPYYSYRLVVAPEHFGTICYLSDIDDEEVKQFKYAFFLEMVGSGSHISLQKTFTGVSEVDRVCEHYFKHMTKDTFVDDFRKIIGNDETVWESAGFEIPTASISRYPYPEYHTNFDNELIITEEKLEETVQHMLKIFFILENNVPVVRKFRGLIALSNPQYDLYISNFDPSMRPEIDQDQKKWNYLMDCIPRYFDGKMTILEMAEKHDLYFEDVFNYVKKFEDKDLVDIQYKK